MPLLSFGFYKASLRLGDGGNPSAVSEPFFYCPINRLVIGGVLLFLLVPFFRGVPGRQREYRARYVILVPGLVGIFLYHRQAELIGAFSLPLLIPTVCLLVWNAFRARGLKARCLVVLASVLLVTLILFDVSQGSAIGQGVIIGLLFALPTVVFHWFIRKEVSALQVVGGLAAGSVLPIVLLLCFIPHMGSPIQVLFMFLFFVASVVPLASLVLRNRWARDVAMGHYEEEPKEVGWARLRRMDSL